MKSIKNVSLRIVIAGYIVGGPLGGLVWHHLQYVLGLSRLGHDVLFVEDSNDYPSCYNPETYELSTDPTYGIRFIQAAFTRFDMGDRWAYYNACTNRWLGMDEKRVKHFSATADLFLNLSGINPLREIFQHIPVRVFIDTDPVFTQIRHLTDPHALELAQRHTHFLTFGENFGKVGNQIPDDGLPWKATRQPVVTDIWEYTPGNEKGKWTTVMQWDSYKVCSYLSKEYGMKSASFDPYLKLPDHITDPVELALGSESAPREKLSRTGWLLADPLLITKIPESYQQYIQSSKGEWSVAKQGYVAARSGWFSERSTCYLASGRPVIVQDTGFSGFIKTGDGLFSFTSPEEAVEAIEIVNGNYKNHCEAARSVAEVYFKYDRVLNELLNVSFA